MIFKVCTIMLLFVLSGCGQIGKLKRLEKISLPAFSAAGANFCVDPGETFKRNLKFIFIFDYSGSNINPGSDPTGDRRFGGLTSFLDTMEQDDTVYYSFIEFNRDARKKQDFTNDLAGFKSFVRQEHAGRIDQLATNYVDALTKAELMIADDVQALIKKKQDNLECQRTVFDPLSECFEKNAYVLFFVSDGKPNPGCNRLGDAVPSGMQEQCPEHIKFVIDQIMNLAAGTYGAHVASVNLHTVYYKYGDDADYMRTKQGMQDMAVWGSGQFNEVTDGHPIDFTKFLLPEEKIQNALRDIFVVNLNTVWNDGILQHDADADGLSDLREIQLRSDPSKWDTDGDGISDFVRYNTFASPCRWADCRPEAPMSQCGQYLLNDPARPDQIFTDSDGDGLNDCEEDLVVHSSHKKWDTNLNLIPDWIEFRSGLPILQEVDQALNNPDNDGLNNYQEVQKNTPIDIANGRVLLQDQYIHKLTMLSDVDGRQCFSLDVSEIPTIGDNNKIRVYVVQTTKATIDRRTMRVAEKTLQSGTSAVSFTNDDFKQEFKFQCAPTQAYCPQ